MLRGFLEKKHGFRFFIYVVKLPRGLNPALLQISWFLNRVVLDWTKIYPGGTRRRLRGHQRVRGAGGPVRGGGTLPQHAGRPPVRVRARLCARPGWDPVLGYETGHLLQQGHRWQVNVRTVGMLLAGKRT